MQNPTNYNFRQKELDERLFDEFLKDSPSEQHIHELITSGANINAVLNGENILMNTISYRGEDVNLQSIQLMIDLGVDVNYEDEGFNSLFDAMLKLNPDLVELLLNAGANPNCVAFEEKESLLDWAYYKWYIIELGENDELTGKMERIVRLFEKYGAKYTEDIFADKP